MMLYDMTGAQMPMITQDNYGKWHYLYRVDEYPNKGFGLMYYYRRDDGGMAHATSGSEAEVENE